MKLIADAKEQGEPGRNWVLPMDMEAWSDYAMHLKDKHGWDNSEEIA